MTYRETVIAIHVQAKTPHEAINRLLEQLMLIEHEFAEKGEGYIKVEFFNNEIEEVEPKP